MNISNVNFQFNSKVAPNKLASNSVLFSGNNDDLFVKTQISKEEKVSSSKYETALSCQELEKIYATTFENSIKMNYFSKRRPMGTCPKDSGQLKLAVPG